MTEDKMVEAAIILKVVTYFTKTVVKKSEENFVENWQEV